MSFESALADFAWKLFRAASPEGENSFISPVSISVALGMVLAGADGSTAKEMQNVMLKGVDSVDVHANFAKIMASLNPPQDSPFKLHTANKIVSHDKFPLLAEFTKILLTSYKAEPATVDFADGAKREQMRQEINGWVEQVTQDKIKDLIPSSAVDAMTRLILVNAIYFKGSWKHQFKPERTSKAPFHVSANNTIQVDMMHITKEFPYYETSDMQVLGMPYVSGNEALHMFVFLPKEKNGLEKMEKDLTGEDMLDMIKETRESEVNVQFPRFKLEKSMELKKSLQALGMGEMFTCSANFDKMAGPNQDLYVSAVIHKAFVEVNEEGTEAAAATAVIMARCAMVTIPPIQFTANHPFVFSIVAGNQILFVGRIVKL